MCRKITKNFKNFKNNLPILAIFAYIGVFLYLCTMKRIEYIAPIDYMRGNISGRQSLEYNGAGAYETPIGSKQSADVYAPRIVTMFHADKRTRMKYYSIRTRTSVHMTSALKTSMATMGGAGALYASLLRNKSAQIYSDIVGRWHSDGHGTTLREYFMRTAMDALTAKNANIDFGESVLVVNPWISTSAQNVPISQSVVDKFASILG